MKQGKDTNILKIDKLGRITIPRTIRDKYNINLDSPLVTTEKDEGILICNQSTEPSDKRRNHTFTYNEEYVNKIRNEYPVGTRIELIEMKDELNPVPYKTKGTVTSVDDIGSIQMLWDNGRTLALIPEEDSFNKISK